MKPNHASNLLVLCLVNENKLLFKSSSWVLGVAWFNRFLGFASVFILARLLSPDDFGLFAILLLVIQLSSTLSNIGIEQYYIQKPHVTSQELDTCWTFNLVINASLTAVLIAFSPLITSSLGREHYSLAMIVMSTLPLINALGNGFVIHLKRQLEFHDFAKFSAFGQILGSICSIIVAWLYATYWALVVGMLVNAITQTTLSYLLLPKRTRLRFTQFGQPWQFGKWILLRNSVAHTRAKFDVWFAATTFNLSNIGGYNTLKDIAMLPSREIVGPLFQVFFAFMSRENRDVKRAERVYATCFIMFALCVPMSLGIFAIAEDLTLLLLGEQWVKYAPVLANLAILTISATTGDFVSDALLSRGMVKHVLAYDMLTLIVCLISLLCTINYLSSPQDLSVFRMLLSIFLFSTSLLWLYLCLKLKTARIVRMISAFSVSGGIMLLCVQSVDNVTASTLLQVCISIATGTISYILMIYISFLVRVFSFDDRDFLKKVAIGVKSKIFNKAT